MDLIIVVRPFQLNSTQLNYSTLFCSILFFFLTTSFPTEHAKESLMAYLPSPELAEGMNDQSCPILGIGFVTLWEAGIYVQMGVKAVDRFKTI